MEAVALCRRDPFVRHAAGRGLLLVNSQPEDS